LTIGIVVVDDHAAEMAVDSSRAQDRSHEDAELRKKRVMDVVSAGGLDRIELGLSLLPA
jgi:hypothetical protein